MADSQQTTTGTEVVKSEDVAQNQPPEQQQQEEVEMWTYYDPETGERVTFPKPDIPAMEDIIDEYVKLIPELEEVYDDERYVRPPELQEKLNESDKLTRQELVEIAMHEDRWLMEQEEKRKAVRVKRKLSLIRRFLKVQKNLRWDFPKVEKKYTEEMLGEEWVEQPLDWNYESGHDPMVPSEPPPAEDIPKIREQAIKNIRRQKKEWKKMAKDPKKVKAWIKQILTEKETPKDEMGHPLRNYYVPYYRNYPVVPKDHPGIRNQYDVLDEMERYDMFIHWRSYMFEDGNSYEGTVWDDTACGLGVLKAEDMKYEGQFLLNQVEGYGVLDLFVPPYEQPIPDSKEEKKMRAEGKFVFADYLDPETREWLKKDMEDLAERTERLKKLGLWEKPEHYADDPLFVELYGEPAEKGLYKYSGKWKHSRMHGCGILEVNDTVTYGKWYFSELMPDPEECSITECTRVAAAAKIAAAKAKMFSLKPDGMVKGYYGPFNDPVHPYIYLDDLWMAPGWVNAFYEVPDEWKKYVEVVDEEQEQWIDIYRRNALITPGPSEQEYMWENADNLMIPMEDGTVHNIHTGTTYQVVQDPLGRVTYVPIPENQDLKYIPFTREEFYYDPPPEKRGIQKWLSSFRDHVRKSHAETEEKLKKYILAAHKTMQVEKEVYEKKRKILQEEYEIKNAEIREAYEALRESFGKRDKEMEMPQEEAAGRGDYVEKAEEVKADEEEEEEDDTKPRSFGRVEHDEEETSETGDDEENDDKKPRGFGKVAEVEEDNKSEGSTPFAAISLSPWLRMALSQTTKRAVRRHQESMLLKPERPVESEPIAAFVNLRRVGGKKQPVTLRIVNGAKQCGVAPRLSKAFSQRVVLKSSREPEYSGTWKTSEKQVLSMAIPV